MKIKVTRRPRSRIGATEYDVLFERLLPDGHGDISSVGLARLSVPLLFARSLVISFALKGAESRDEPVFEAS